VPIRRGEDLHGGGAGRSSHASWLLRQDELMNKFKVKVARIEASKGSRAASQVCITFHIKSGPVDFQVPIHLKVSDYDDTEMVQAARSALHRVFVELGNQTLDWKLSPTELRLLTDMSVRPAK
jgi:hypothetical protein